MSIGELAKAVGVSRDTLRHYERKGVIAPARSANGYRVYLTETVERVRLVRRALSVGFTLAELARLFSERKKGGAPCRQAFSLAASKLEDLEERIKEMQNLRDELQRLVRDWNEKLGENEGREKPVFLLEALTGGNGETGKKAATISKPDGKFLRRRSNEKK